MQYNIINSGLIDLRERGSERHFFRVPWTSIVGIEYFLKPKAKRKPNEETCSHAIVYTTSSVPRACTVSVTLEDARTIEDYLYQQLYKPPTPSSIRGG